MFWPLLVLRSGFCLCLCFFWFMQFTAICMGMGVVSAECRPFASVTLSVFDTFVVFNPCYLLVYTSS